MTVELDVLVKKGEMTFKVAQSCYNNLMFTVDDVYCRAMGMLSPEAGKTPARRVFCKRIGISEAKLPVFVDYIKPYVSPSILETFELSEDSNSKLGAKITAANMNDIYDRSIPLSTPIGRESYLARCELRRMKWDLKRRDEVLSDLLIKPDELNRFLDDLGMTGREFLAQFDGLN